MPKFTVTFSDGRTDVVQAKSLLGLAMQADRNHWEVEKIEKYVPKMVTRRNFMSGQEYQEAEDTPLCCSPASETYWSM